MGSPERIRAVAERVARTLRQGHQCAVVVSAMGHSTDALLDLAHQITNNPDRRELDALLATGEQVTTALLAMALQEQGIPARSLTGWQAGIQTESAHGSARIEAVESEALQEGLREGWVPIIAGFQGIAGTAITTLGRGGSDTTAVAIAAALQADLCEIYTDVDGVYTADPRKVKSARKLDVVSYDEMLELAQLGSQVLHPRAVETAKRNGVSLVVRSSFQDAEGTVVKDMASMEGARIVTSVACEREVARIAVVGISITDHHLADLFTMLAESRVNVDVIVQSVVRQNEVDVSFTVQEADVQRAVDVITAHAGQIPYANVISETGLSKISIVGAGMISNPGVAAHMFSALKAAGATVKLVSTSEIKVSCVIENACLDAALQSVHDAFDLENIR